ncbi:hypothetical protein D3C80_1162300 [compost metagenome]
MAFTFGRNNTEVPNLRKENASFLYRITDITLSELHPVTEPAALTDMLSSRIYPEISNGKNGTTMAVGNDFMMPF